MVQKEEIKKAVRENYGAIARNASCSCAPTQVSGLCCGGASADVMSLMNGYSNEDLDSVPEGANLGLGCGNPIALASLKEGEIVLDLGSGAGFDCFLAAKKVGAKGKVIGVDMTPEMIASARANAKKGNFTNVEFRQGEIEDMPVDDNTVDIIISNCVINLSPDKPQVFKEAYRVLKPGGRVMVSDMVLKKELPESIKKSAAALVSCVGGASMIDDYLGAMKKAGFKDVKILEEEVVPIELLLTTDAVKQIAEQTGATQAELREAGESVVSVKVQAVKKK